MIGRIPNPFCGFGDTKCGALIDLPVRRGAEKEVGGHLGGSRFLHRGQFFTMSIKRYPRSRVMKGDRKGGSNCG